MKKLLFILFLLITIKVYAMEVDYTIEGFYVDATVLENGDMLVKEAIVQKGYFNGYRREITLSGVGTINSLYNASNIELIKICKSNLTSFEALNNPIDCFNRVSKGNLGDKQVYEINDIYGGKEYRMFNYTNGDTTTFYIEYIVKDIAIKYNDIGELRWNFIPGEFIDQIGDLEVRVSLKTNQNTLRIWSHGPLYVENKILDQKTVNITTTQLPNRTPVDIRIVFDSNYLSQNKKAIDSVMLDKIVEEETILADKANQEREEAKEQQEKWEEAKEQQEKWEKEELEAQKTRNKNANIFNGLFGAWFFRLNRFYC